MCSKNFVFETFENFMNLGNFQKLLHSVECLKPTWNTE